MNIILVLVTRPVYGHTGVTNERGMRMAVGRALTYCWKERAKINNETK
jgi:hypothetical protein